MLVNQIFVTLGVFLLIEVQMRYIHNVQVYVFILAGLGIDLFACWGKLQLKKIRREGKK